MSSRRSGWLRLLASTSILAAAACSTLIGLTDPRPADTSSEAGTGPDDASSNLPDGGTDPGAGCDADVASDTSNCGVCGHVCSVGQCDKGRCTPVKIASDLGDAQELLIDDESIFVNAKQYLKTIPKANWDAGVISVPNPYYSSTRMALDSHYVYLGYSSNANDLPVVEACPRPCTKDSVRVPIYGPGVANDLVVANDFGTTTFPLIIYMATGATPGEGLYRPAVDDAGGLSTQEIPALNVRNSSSCSALSGHCHFVRNFGGTLYWSESNGLRSLSPAPSAPKQGRFDISPYLVTDFGIAGDDVILIDRLKQIIHGRLSPETGAVASMTQIFSDASADLLQIEMDGSRFYLRSTHAIRSCSFNACLDAEMVSLPDEKTAIHSIAVDKDVVYYLVQDRNAQPARVDLYTVSK